MSTIPVTAGPELPRQDIPREAPQPALTWDQLSGFMQRENSLLSAMAQDFGVDPGPADPRFSLTEHLKGSRHEARFDQYLRLGATNANRAMQLDRQFDREDRNRELSDQLPWYLALPAGVAAGVADPTILLPGAGLVRATRGGYAIARSAGMIGASAGAAVAAQEALLQSTQLTRPLSESVVNVGAGVILGGLIGGGAASLLSRSELAQSARGLRQVYMDDGAGVSSIPDLTPARQREWAVATSARQAELADSFRYEVPTVQRNVNIAELRPVDNLVLREIADIQRTLDDAPVLGAAKPAPETPFVAVARSAEELERGNFAIVSQFRDPEVIAKIQEAYPERLVLGPDEFATAQDFALAPQSFYSPTSQARDVGAAANNRLLAEDTELVGSLPRALADKLQWLSPNIRQSVNPFPALREYWQRLVETPFLTKGAQRGVAVAPGGAASRRAQFIEANYLTTKDNVDALYAKMVREGTNLSREQFNEQIGQTLWYSQVSPNKFIDEGAELWNEHFNRLFDQGVEAGIFRKDVDGGDVEGVDRFIPRDANRDAFVQYREVFVKRAEDWYAGHLQQRYVEAEAQLAERKATLQDRADFLRMSPEEAERELSLLADRIAETSGEPRKKLQRLAGEIRRTQGGRELAQEQIQTRIDNLFESAHASLERVLNAGRRLERELGLMDSRVTAREEYSGKLMELLQKEQRGLDKLIEKTSAQIAKQETVIAQALEGERTLAAGTKATAQAEQFTTRLADLQAQKAELNSISKQSELLDQFQQRMDERFPGASAEEKLDMVREGINLIVARTNELNLRRGAAVRDLVAKMAKADPALVKERAAALDAKTKVLDDEFFERWFRRTDEELAPTSPDGRPQFRVLANDIANYLADSYMGLKRGGFDRPDLPVHLTQFQRGPLKNRTNIMPNEAIDPPGDPIQFFYKNIEDVAQLHSRRTSGQIAIGQVFDKDFKLTAIFGDEQLKLPGLINEQHALYRGYVTRATSADEVYRVSGMKSKRNESLEEAKSRAFVWLDQWQETTKKDFGNAYQALSGTLYQKEQLSDIGSISRIAKAVAYIRVMGGNGLSMFTDTYMPALVLGMRNHLTQGVLPLATSSAIRGAAKAELEFMGLALNHVVNRNVLAMADIGDPLARGNAVERVLDKMTSIGSKWNGSQYMQDAGETLAGMTTMRLLMQRVREPGKFATDLADAGIDETMAGRIAGQIEKYKKTTEGVEFPNLAGWQDVNAARAFQAAVARQVDAIFSTRRVGNTPWVMSHPVGSMILQFQSYNIAQTQTILLRGLQDNQRRLLQGLIPLTMMGAAVAYTQAALRGGESLEKFERNMAENPGFLIAEGLDRGSPFPLAFTFANLLESGTRAAGPDMRFNPIKDAVMAPFGPLPSELQYTPQGRDFVSQLLGPTAGGLGQVPGALGGIGTLVTGGEPTGGQSKSMQSVTPYGTYPGMRQAIQWLMDDLPGGN